MEGEAFPPQSGDFLPEQPSINTPQDHTTSLGAPAAHSQLPAGAPVQAPFLVPAAHPAMNQPMQGAGQILDSATLQRIWNAGIQSLVRSTVAQVPTPAAPANIAPQYYHGQQSQPGHPPPPPAASTTSDALLTALTNLLSSNQPPSSGMDDLQFVEPGRSRADQNMPGSSGREHQWQ